MVEGWRGVKGFLRLMKTRIAAAMRRLRIAVERMVDAWKDIVVSVRRDNDERVTVRTSPRMEPKPIMETR